MMIIICLWFCNYDTTNVSDIGAPGNLCEDRTGVSPDTLPQIVNLLLDNKDLKT